MKQLWKKIGLIVLFVAVILALPASAAKVYAGSNLSTATKYNIGSSRTGTLNANKGEYYKFTLSSAAHISFTLRTEAHNQHAWMRLLNSKGEQMEFIATSDPYNWGYQKKSLDYSLNAGTYFIKIENGSYRQLSYTLKTSQIYTQTSSVKIAGPNNNYLSKAVGFSIGNKLRGVATGGFNGLDWDDCHYYRFYLPKTTKIAFSGYSAFSGCKGQVWMYLYNSSGKYVSQLGTLSSSGKNSWNKTITLNGGTYYIGVCTPDDLIPYLISTSEVKQNSGKVVTGKVFGLQVSSPQNGKVRITWQRQNCRGYEVQYCQARNFRYSKLYKKIIYGSYMTSYAAANLERNKYYHVRVRAFKDTDKGRVFGEWSTSKSVKIR